MHPPAPGPSKAVAFSEETLFFMFYAHPRDALQEIAAQELYVLSSPLPSPIFRSRILTPIALAHRWNRNWRFNKDLRLWLTKESGHVRHAKPLDGGLGEQGLFTYWDPDNWEKGRKEFTVLYSELEDKSSPVFAGPSLQPAAGAAGAGVGAGVGGQAGGQSAGGGQAAQAAQAAAQLQQQQQTQARGGFQGMSLAAATAI